MKLTIGMSTYNDKEGVFFTIQSLRLYHNLKDCEILIIDNKGDPALETWVNNWGHKQIRYVKYIDSTGMGQPRNMVFKEAKGEYVLCLDSHVLLYPGALKNILHYMKNGDLIQGPMLADCCTVAITHMIPSWRANTWGIWAKAIPLDKLPKKPFPIPMHGLGLFGCKKDAWLGFYSDPKSEGCMADEGYIHEKYYQAGKNVLCIPWLLWVHYFRPGSPSYPISLLARIKRYLAEFNELNIDITPIIEHYGSNIVSKIAKEIKIDLKKERKRPLILEIKKINAKSTKEVYNYIYSHPTQKGLYGGTNWRAEYFIKFIKENVPLKSKILDAGCGRGFLLRWLNIEGYIAQGTEIADWLLKPGGDLCGQPVVTSSYDQLGSIAPQNYYEVVISNDVLEHLKNESEVKQAIKDLTQLTNKYILVSTGGTQQAANPFSKELGIPYLHNIIKPKDWWLNLCKEYFDIIQEFKIRGSYFIFGKKKENSSLKKILFPEYPLTTSVGSLYKSINKDILKKYSHVVVGKNKINSAWNLAWGEKKNYEAVIETGFFWDAMHIDTKGLYQNSSLNDWNEISKFKAPKAAKDIILNSKHSSKYTQPKETIHWEGVVLACQNPSDRSVLSCGTTRDYYCFIASACRYYGLELFIKLHPWNNEKVIDEIKKIASPYGCRFIKCNHSIIKKCKFVLIYNSSFAVDCFLREVPVVQYAPGYWHKTPAVFYTNYKFINHLSDRQKNSMITAGTKLTDFLVWKYCFNMSMSTKKWIDMLNYFANSKEIFPMKKEWSYAENS